MCISFIWLYGRRKEHTSWKTVMKHHWHSYYRHCPEYKFTMQVFAFIHQNSLCEWMYHWSVAIDPVLNLIVMFLFSCEPGEKKKGRPNVMVTTCSTVKGSFIDQDRQTGRRERYFSRTPTVWHFRKAVLSILSPSIIAHKEHRCLDWGNLSYGLHTMQRQRTGLDVALQRRQSR